jgi:hypothetical protein
MMATKHKYRFFLSPKQFPKEIEDHKLDADRIQLGGTLKRFITAFFSKWDLLFPLLLPILPKDFYSFFPSE